MYGIRTGQRRQDVPNDINVIIEISAQGDPIKFEVDKDSGAVFVVSLHGHLDALPAELWLCPAHHRRRWRPGRRAGRDPFPLQPGVVIRCRPVGVLKMEDDGGVDAKVVAVPVSKLTAVRQGADHRRPARAADEADGAFLRALQDLEPGKWVRSLGWGTVEDAKAEIWNGLAAGQEVIPGTHVSMTRACVGLGRGAADGIGSALRPMGADVGRSRGIGPLSAMAVAPMPGNRRAPVAGYGARRRTRPRNRAGGRQALRWHRACLCHPWPRVPASRTNAKRGTIRALLMKINKNLIFAIPVAMVLGFRLRPHRAGGLA